MATSRGLYASYDAGASWAMLAPNTSYNLVVRRAPETDTPTRRASGQGSPDLPDDGYQVFLPLAAVQGSGRPTSRTPCSWKRISQYPTTQRIIVPTMAAAPGSA